ncbi:MAG: hypothetical protein H0S85_02655 [Desulfovibrionaceae bacterium]|jgi:hypothetical protein|nr:hypothetical protein [Desulfovibrionaceae bacterium]
MQKRYCTCGREVWVQFMVKRQGVRFWTLTTTWGRNIRRCPECGGLLSLDGLK